MSEPTLYFKHMSGSDLHFPKSEILPIYLALYIFSMCLHRCFEISLEATTLDI